MRKEEIWLYSDKEMEFVERGAWVKREGEREREHLIRRFIEKDKERVYKEIRLLRRLLISQIKQLQFFLMEKSFKSMAQIQWQIILIVVIIPSFVN